MRQATIFGLVVSILVIAGLAAMNGPLLLAAVPLVLYLSAELATAPGPPALSVERSIAPVRARSGEAATVTISLSNEGSSLGTVRVTDRLPAGLELVEGSNEWLVKLPAGASHAFSYQVKARRGAYHFAALSVTLQSRLGLLQRIQEYVLENDVFFYPVREGSALKYIDIRPRRTKVYSGTIDARIGGEGTDFFGVRSHQFGDAFGRINWRASARHYDTLFTNEYVQERVADVGIILDARVLSNLPDRGHSLLEHSIDATTYLVDAFISMGNRVALLIYGEQLDYTLPGYGKIQRERIMHALARASLGRSQVFEALTALPTRLFPAQSQIIFVSPLLDSDVPFLRRLSTYGYQVMVISPDPVLYEASRLGDQPAVRTAARLAKMERELLLTQLLQAGIFVVSWDTAQRFDETAGARLRSTRLAR